MIAALIQPCHFSASQKFVGLLPLFPCMVAALLFASAIQSCCSPVLQQIWVSTAEYSIKLSSLIQHYCFLVEFSTVVLRPDSAFEFSCLIQNCCSPAWYNIAVLLPNTTLLFTFQKHHQSSYILPVVPLPGTALFLSCLKQYYCSLAFTEHLCSLA